MKISLAINTRNPVKEWLDQLIETAFPFFDEIVIYMDGVKDPEPVYSEHIRIIGDGQARDLKDGFNYAVENTTGDWICAFSDDDFFLCENLDELVRAIKSGAYQDADIIHFPISTANGNWGSAAFIYEDLCQENLIPAGSFFRRHVFDGVQGFKVNCYADWNFWLRADFRQYKFKYFPKPVYFFRQSERSATAKMLAEVGGHDNAKRIVLENVRQG